MSWRKPERIESVKLLQFLPPLFKSLDVKKLHPQASIWLNRALKRGQIKRIIKGYYLNSLKCEMAQKWPELEDIACYIRSPSYVSKEWALNFHGVLGQVPYTCTLITLANSVGRRNEIILDDYRLEYSKIKGELFFGFELRGNHYLATPEKALLDVMYLENRIPFYDELDYELLDFKRLWEMAEKFPPRVREMVDTKLFNPPSNIPELFEKAATYRATPKREKALTLDKVLKVLRRRKPEFEKAYGVTEIGVFGSVARKEWKPGSDVDVVVKMKIPDLFYMVHIKEELGDEFGTEVDIIHYHEDMHSILREVIDKEAIYV